MHAALTTDYVYRGVSNSDEHAAAQLGVDFRTAGGVYAGAWASSTDLNTGGRHRPYEVDYYLGYVRYFGSRWSVSVTLNRYTYPGGEGNVDYAYTEVGTVLGYDDRVWLEFSYTGSLYGHDAPARNVELLSSWPLPGALSLSAGLGYFDVSELAGNGYWHWQAGLSQPLGRVSVDLRYHDTASVPQRFSDGELADARIVLTLGVDF